MRVISSNIIAGLEELQTELLLTLMDDTDGSTTKPSSRRIFLGKFRTLRQQFYALYRVAVCIICALIIYVIHILLVLPVISCFAIIQPQKTPGSSLYLVHPFFLRLLHVVEVLWSREVGDLQPTLVSPSKFYDGSIPYYDIDRLGGVLLYLLKAFPNDSEHGLETSQPTHETAVTDSSRAVVESSSKFPHNKSYVKKCICSVLCASQLNANFLRRNNPVFLKMNLKKSLNKQGRKSS